MVRLSAHLGLLQIPNLSIRTRLSTMSHRHADHAHTAASAANPNNSTAQDIDQVAAWFQKFAPFVYDTSASTRSNFDCLASQRNWGDKLRRKQWTSLQAASAAPNHTDADANAHTDTPNQGGAWFQQFENFVHDPTVGIRSNFERLAAQRSWGSRLKQRRWAECQEEEFGYAYGTNTTKLESWQKLCQGGVSIAPEAVTTASASSSDRSTPPPSDDGSSDEFRDYFSQEKFNGFVPDPEDDLIAKLSKLSIHQGWSKSEAKRRRAEVVEFEVSRHYGHDKSKLENWQKLCRDVKIEPALSRVYVNIFNILDHLDNPERYDVVVFKNYKLFRAYTLKSRIFPLDLAKEDGFVKALLRPLYMRRK
ncbi:hypothetical protein J4E93_000307 [Alternaria ventricosa]|uniref:uncharacterized protein n=1 Tax=Alternaria ventricosa TaxID=1187951 RepID=UPI0020C291F2|nr:uncharacterized protein J4E93_000307 [Alternaria ventricosa]KAI4655593.1 hypothetical protein J4E93_000307 [Alternaria ventricosa]